MSRPRKELEPADVTAVVDTREGLPLDLRPLSAIVAGLPTGDYSVAGLEHEIAVERKSLTDLVMCCGAERERFEREVQRLLAYPSRLLVVEATWGAIELGGWRGKLQPAHVQGALLGWVARGLPVLTVSDHAAAGHAVARFLFIAARHRWRALQSFIPTLKIAGEANGARRAERPQVDPGGGQRDGEVDARERQGDPASSLRHRSALAAR